MDRANNTNDDHLASFTIDIFCARHQMSRSYYYYLREQGLAPKEIRFGRFIRITRRAEREWLAKMEAGANPARQSRKPEDPSRGRSSRRKQSRR